MRRAVNRALSKLFKKAARFARTRLTAAGKALAWVLGADGIATQEYVLTSREAGRRKVARKISHASRQERLQSRIDRRRKSGKQS